MNLLIIVISSLLIFGCSQSNKHSYQGYVEAENIYLALPYSGVLKTMFVQRGERVKKGKLLFELDMHPQDFQVRVNDAVLLQERSTLDDSILPKRLPEIETISWQVVQAEAQIQLAQLRVKRYGELVQKHALDKDTLDSAKEHYNELVAVKNQYQANLALVKLGSREQQINAHREQVKGAAAQLSAAEWQLAQKKLYAPADGFIFDTYYRPGEFVSAEHPVASLLSPDNVRIEFFVPVQRLAKLHIGQKISFTCDNCTKDNSAVIRYISPEAEYVPPLVYSRENNEHLVFRIKATTEHSSQLKPGQPVMVTSSDDDN